MAEKRLDERAPYLIRMVKFPLDEVIQFFSTGRKPIAKFVVPRLIDDCSHHLFAESWEGGLFHNVAIIEVERKRSGLAFCSLSVKKWLKLGRLPNKNYFSTSWEIASLGGGNGTGHVSSVWHDFSAFLPEVEETIPRLKEYRYWNSMVQCIWSMRDPRLKGPFSRLKSRSKKVRFEAISELSRMKWEVDSLPGFGKRLLRDGDVALRDLLLLDREAERWGLLISGSLIHHLTPLWEDFSNLFKSWASSSATPHRIAAARGLELLTQRENSYLPSLLELMADPKDEVRLEAAISIFALRRDIQDKRLEKELSQWLMDRIECETVESIRLQLARHLIFCQRVNPKAKRFVSQNEWIQKLAQLPDESGEK